MDSDSRRLALMDLAPEHLRDDAEMAAFDPDHEMLLSAVCEYPHIACMAIVSFLCPDFSEPDYFIGNREQIAERIQGARETLTGIIRQKVDEEHARLLEKWIDDNWHCNLAELAGVGDD